jgi:hypothetical protein
MAAHASFIVADNVPANHTFSRVDIDGQTVRYQERTGTSSLAWKNWVSSIRAPLPGNGAKVYKVVERFTMPVTADETINGVTVPKKVREYVAEVTFTLPADGSDTERAAFEAMFRNGLASTTVQDNTRNLLPLNGP